MGDRDTDELIAGDLDEAMFFGAVLIDGLVPRRVRMTVFERRGAHHLVLVHHRGRPQR